MSRKTELNAQVFGSINKLCRNPTEVIVLSYIASFTVFGEGYYAGQDRLAEECHCSTKTIQRTLDALKDRGLVLSEGRKKTYSTTVYKASPAVLALLATAKNFRSAKSKCPPEQDNLTVKSVEEEKRNPPYPPKGAKVRKELKSKIKKNRALDYICTGETYTEEGLRKMGISTGEEFYEE